MNDKQTSTIQLSKFNSNSICERIKHMYRTKLKPHQQILFVSANNMPCCNRKLDILLLVLLARPLFINSAQLPITFILLHI